MDKINSEIFVSIVNEVMNISEEEKGKLVKRYNEYMINASERVDPRVKIIRSLVARGTPLKTISSKLGIATYQILTPLQKKKTIEGDQKWTYETLRASEEYKTMTWTKEELDYIVALPPTKDFNYSNIENFRNVLQDKSEQLLLS